jgi:maleate cis-trans isomerase
MLEYAAHGAIGVMTPQANTTVEPECWALLPPHMSLLNARLTSDKDTIEARLVDYTTKFVDVSAQFANAPVISIAAACTGASYLVGAAHEARLVRDVEAARGVPFLTAALASVAALRGMGAQRIALLSPYPDALNLRSAAYWQGHGFDVVAKAGPALMAQAFHPIYAMEGDGVLRAYAELSDSGADAVLMLGTGMATLRPILAGRAAGLLPAVSCNLALVWAARQGRRWDALDSDDLSDWLAGAHWAARLDALFPEAAA